jgi:putative FmdB family regulatory protein
MPIYEYRCNACGRIIEVMQKFSDKPLSRCPACSGKVSRIISNCTFHLKGTGWYVTDYKKGDSAMPSKEKASETHKSETPKTEPAKTETSKETKTESKTSG